MRLYIWYPNEPSYLKRFLLPALLLLCFGGLRGQTSQGTDFWIASTYPFYSNDSFTVAVASEKPTTAYLEIPLMNYKDSVVLGYNEIKYMLIPKSFRVAYYYYYSTANPKIGSNAIHVTSKLPVRVYSFSDGNFLSCGATAVYPTKTQTPGGTYYPYKSRYYWSGGGSSSYKVFFFTVVGVDDSVTVSFKTNTTSMWNLPPGNQITLRKGEMVRIYSWIFGFDPTLSVTASQDKRIAVFTENFYDYAIAGCFQYDLMYEQILPTNILGSDFILTPYMYHKKGYDYTVTAVDTNTIVKKDGVPIDTLDAGGTYYGRVYSDSSVHITSDKPINCWEKNILDTCRSGSWGWWYSGPSIMTVSTSEQMIADATVSVPTSANFSDNYINIITNKFGRDSTWLDGNLIPSNEFTPIISSQYYLYRDTITKGNHRITGPYGFISYIYGRGVYGGYAYNASAGLQSLKRIILSETYLSCDTGRIVKLTSQGDPAKNFKWEFNGQTDTGLTAYFQVKKEGTYPVKLKYQLYRNNLWDSVIAFLQIKGTQTLDFIKGEDNRVCKSTYTITLPKSKLFKYLWNTGDTGHILTTAANGKFSVIVTNTETGCKFYDTTEVSLFDKLTPDFSVTMAKRCPGFPIYLQNLSTLGKNDSITKYEWFVDNLPDGKAKHDTVHYAYPGLYDFRLIITSKSGCKDSISKQINVSDNPALVIGIRAIDSCFQRSNIRFNSRSSLTVGKITGYKWIFSDGDTMYKKQQAIRNIRDSGLHWVQFTAFSDAGCSDTTDKLYYRIYGAPWPAFDVTDSSVCNSGNYFSVVNNTNTHNQAARYEWQWGDGTGETFEEPGYKNYSDTGTYTIALVSAYLSTGCSDTVRRTVRVLPNPKAILQVDSFNYCLNRNYYHFTDKSDAKGATVRYAKWVWGDGTFNDTAAMAKTYSKDGTYKVKLYFSTGKGCLDSAQKNVVVYKSPVAAFSVPDSNICGPDNYFNITNNSTAPGNAKWLWMWGDGNSSTVKNPGKLSYSFYGTYTAVLAVTDPLLNCSDTVKRQFTVLKGPELNPVYSDTVVCDIQSQITFTDSTDYGNMLPNRKWIFNNNLSDTSTQTSFTRGFAVPGTFKVMLSGGIPGVCVDSISRNIVVRYKDSVAAFTSKLHYLCAPATADLTAKPKAGSNWNYEWDPGTGNFSETGASLTNYAFNSAGKYTIRLRIVDDLNCTYETAEDIEIFKNPEVILNNNTRDTQCMKGNNFVFQSTVTDTFPTAKYRWVLGEGAVSGLAIPGPRTYSGTGEKRISLIVTDGHNCVDSASLKIFVNESPRISLKADSVCVGQNLILVPLITPQSVVIDRIYWYRDGQSAGIGNTFGFNSNAAGLFRIQAIAEAAGGCRDTASEIILTVIDKPVASFGAALGTATSSGVKVDFLDSSTGATKWTWYPEYPDQSIASGGKNFSYLYSHLGKVTARLVVENDFGCRDFIDHEYDLISEELLFMPTSFTPNGDSKNDFFKPSELSAVSFYQISIYNRWGQKLFESNNPEIGWDGTFEGEQVPQGAYAYFVNVVFLTGKRQVLHGDITIIR